MFATPRKLDPEHKINRELQMAKLFFHNRDYQSAKEHIEFVLDLKPDCSEAYKLLSQINEACGENELAMQNYEKSLKLKSMDNTLNFSPNISPSRLKLAKNNVNNINSNNKVPDQVSTIDIDALKTSIEKLLDGKFSLLSGSFQNVKHQLDNLASLTSKSVQEISSIKKELVEINKSVKLISSKQDNIEKAVTSKSNDQSMKNELNKIQCNFSNFSSDIKQRLDNLTEKVQNIKIPSVNYDEEEYYDEDEDYENYQHQYGDQSNEPSFQNNQANQQQALPKLNELTKFKRQNTWVCQICEVPNDELDLKCASCEEPRYPGQTAPAAVAPATNSLFSTPSNQNSGFNFGFKFGSQAPAAPIGSSANTNSVEVTPPNSTSQKSLFPSLNTTPVLEPANNAGSKTMFGISGQTPVFGSTVPAPVFGTSIQPSIFGTSNQTPVFANPNVSSQKPLFGIKNDGSDQINQPVNFGSKNSVSAADNNNSIPTFSFSNSPMNFSFKMNSENESVPPPVAPAMPETTSAPFSLTSQSLSKPTFSFSGALNSLGGSTLPSFSVSNKESVSDFSKPFSAFGSDQKPKVESFATNSLSSSIFNFSANKQEKKDEEDKQNEPEDGEEFIPKVKLPDNYKHVTGEEGETEIYQKEQVKLYILVEGEYKERGVGILKILKNNETKKYRMVMRRDQVHKVCLNTYLTEDIKFTFKKEKFLLFQCIDFSEETPNPQTFLLKMSDVNALKEFKTFLENLIEGKVLPEEKSAPTAISGNISKQKIENKVVPSKDDDPDIQLIEVKQLTPEQKEKVETLKLPLNFYSEKKPCKGCIGCKNEDDIDWSNLTHSTLEVENKNSKSENGKEGLFANLASDIQETKVDNIRQDGEEGDSNLERTSFVSEKSKLLPTNYKHVTGEENEDVVFKERAKLYRFIRESNEYKERGVGEVRILKNREKGDYRLLMRRDIVLKTIINHKLSPLLKFAEKTPKSLVWACRDYSEKPEGDDEIFLIKFKDEQKCQEFRKAFQQCLAEMEKSKEN